MQDETYRSTPCWPWPGKRLTKGYGTVQVGGKSHFTHRLMWEALNGPIPESMCILHLCDNPPCCNPKHLRLGSHLDNVADMDAKGRRATGARHGMAKLTEADVIAIRAAAATGETPASISRRYPVSRASVDLILQRKTWAHVA
jgi:hypothetical protein